MAKRFTKILFQYSNELTESEDERKVLRNRALNAVQREVQSTGTRCVEVFDYSVADRIYTILPADANGFTLHRADSRK